MQNSNKPTDTAQSIGLIYLLVSEFITPIVLGLLLDWQAGTAPWGTAVGVLLGMTLGGWRVWKLAKKIGNDQPGSKP